MYIAAYPRGVGVFAINGVDPVTRVEEAEGRDTGPYVGGAQGSGKGGIVIEHHVGVFMGVAKELSNHCVLISEKWRKGIIVILFHIPGLFNATKASS